MNEDTLYVFDASHLLYRGIFSAKNLFKKTHLNLSKDPNHDLDDLNSYTESEREEFSNIAIYIIMKSFLSFFSVKNTSIVDPMSTISPVLLFDGKGSTDYRKSLNEDYKGNREFIPLVLEVKNRLKEYLWSLKITTFESDKYEADDIAYGLSKSLGNPIKFITGDWDWLACIPLGNRSDINNRLLYRPSDDWDYNIEDCRDWYKPILKNFKLENRDKLIPSIIKYKKAILGDSSDNIEGIPTIGEVRSNKVITKLLKLKINKQKYSEYPVESSYEETFMDNIETFKTNLKILGYKHVKPEDFINKIFIYEHPNALDIKENFIKMAKEIKSDTFLQNSRYYIDKIDLLGRNPTLIMK